MNNKRPYILAITPARGGSKGVPRKNVKKIAGRPLIEWTIESALSSRLIDRYVVSTEDREIAAVSRRAGAEVLQRPRSLATDGASTLSVLQHAVRSIPCDFVVLLQATSPIRGRKLIDDCIREFISKRCDSLATGFICKFIEYGRNDLRRQDIKGFFYDDGNVYVMRADLLLKGDRYGRKIARKIVSRMENIEIDDEFDLWLAERALEDKISARSKL